MAHPVHKLILAAAAAATCSAAEPAPQTPQAVYQHSVGPFFSQYCYECHGRGRSKGDLALDSYSDLAAVLDDPSTFDTVVDRIRAGEMPPDNAHAQPPDAEREKVADWIEREVHHIDPARPDPGKVTLHRLNRAEYNNTIRDLIGVDFKPADDFPPDDSGYGFDNVSDVLSLSPSLMEKYLAAADRVLDQAIVTEPIQSRVQRIPASLAQVGFNAIGDRGDGWIQLISLEEDDVAADVTLPAAGDYLVRVMAFAKPRGGAMKGAGDNSQMPDEEHPDPMQMAVALNDAYVKRFEVTTDEAHPGIYEARIGAPAGHQRIRAVVPRIRGGSNELIMVNGRIGKQQAGILFVKWIEIEGPLHAATRRFPASEAVASGEARKSPTGETILGQKGVLELKLDEPKGGDVRVRVQAYARQAGTEPAKMQIQLDGKPLKEFDVLAPGLLQPLPKQHVFSLMLLVPQPEVYEVTARVTPGPHTFSAAFLNDFSDPTSANPNLRERKLVIQNIEVANDSEAVLTPPIPDPIQKIFTRRTTPPPAPGFMGMASRALGRPPKPVPELVSARGILEDFASRAWRRPVQATELDRLMRLYSLAEAQGEAYAGRVKLAMKAVLASPQFLYRDGNLGEMRGAAQSGPISEYALASELSYFLWSSMPDDDLFDLASQGRLRAQLDTQVRRMLASPKARALVDNFAGQWLEIRGIETLQPDRTLFPDFDPALALMMKKETELFVESIVRDDRSVLDFLTADYTFVNGRLAKLYGLPGVTGDEFQKVSLAGTPRRGVLTQASILTLTSNPTRTSPVKRGKWVLENILGAPPPPPPPTIPSLDDKTRKLTGTLREQMAQHRTDASCASCHMRMDPIGFSFENFNAIGAWRDKDGADPIDASGRLGPAGAFSGASGMADLLANQKRRDFLRCLCEKMLTYALGRGVERFDRPAVDKIIENLEQNQDRWSSLVLGVVHSVPFQERRNREPTLLSKTESP